MNLEATLKAFKNCKVLIIGDVMIDSYIWGKVDRISPEAPVPVVSVLKQENRLGGAANVMLNIKSLGATPFICAVLGDDAYSKIFIDLLKKENVSDIGIVFDATRPTTIKTRVIGNHQQILRIDQENEQFISEKIRVELIKKINFILQSEKIDVILFEDYDKGVLSEELISLIVAEAKKKSIKTVVDPKKRNFLKYQNVDLFKPNLKELREGLKMEIDGKNQKEIANAMEKLRKELNAGMIMTTLSEDGVLLKTEKEMYHTPAHPRAIADVSGAGDTVISVASLGFAVGLKPEEFSELANLAGGLVCEKVGVVPIDPNELLAEAKKYF